MKNTLQRLKQEAESIYLKAKSGATLTADEVKTLSIYNSLKAKKAFNAGKRKGGNNTQKI